MSTFTTHTRTNTDSLGQLVKKNTLDSKRTAHTPTNEVMIDFEQEHTYQFLITLPNSYQFLIKLPKVQSNSSGWWNIRGLPAIRM